MITNKVQRARNKKILADIEAIEAGGLHGQLPVIWDSARGAHVWDNCGNKFIDFTSTIFVANCGHGLVSNAISKQSRKVIHSYTFPTETKWKFLTEFKAFLPDFCEKIFLASAGSEVTSWAVQLMRAYKGRKTIIHVEGAFHGKTGDIANLNAEEITIAFDRSASPELAQEAVNKIIHKVHTDGIAGIMIESYQGWSARFMNKDYVQGICAWAKDNDIPVCFDEIQGGFWRTGKKFAYEWYEIEPDLICMGKGLGGGLPISALAGRAKYFNVPGLSSTHSGNPLVCAGAREVLKVYNRIEMPLIEKSIIFKHRLEQMSGFYNDIITEVNVHGLLGGVIFKRKEQATAVCEECMSQGLLVVKTGRESVKLGPPLVIEERDLLTGLAILEGAIHQVSRG